MAERIPEFQTVRMEDRKTMEEANLALPWKEKNCLRIIFRMPSELRGSRSISMQQPSARMNERSFLA
jgi:hypothetical protein